MRCDAAWLKDKDAFTTRAAYLLQFHQMTLWNHLEPRSVLEAFSDFSKVIIPGDRRELSATSSGILFPQKEYDISRLEFPANAI